MNVARKLKIPGYRGCVFVISAPSGTGKSTLVRRLLASDMSLGFSVSHTTRRPRASEREGRDYFFVSRRQFEKMRDAGKFVEWAEVSGHLYGTSWAQVRAAQKVGRDVVLDIDVQGHRQIRGRLPEAVSVFVLPPSFLELKRRLQSRHSDAPGEIRKRLTTAREEITHWPEYDYLVVNDRLSVATVALKAIVSAARWRRENQSARAERISRTFGGK